MRNHANECTDHSPHTEALNAAFALQHAERELMRKVGEILSAPDADDISADSSRDALQLPQTGA